LSNEFLADGQEDVTSGQESGTALRKFANEQKKLAEERAAELAELKAQFAKIQAGEIFTKLGVPDKVRKFYSGEPTEDAIKSWVTENADVFGIEVGAETATQTEDQAVQHAQLGAVQQAQQLGADRDTSWTREGMAQKRAGLLANGNSLADLNAVLAEMGVPNVPIQGGMM
jgi:hypothetical protein